MSKSYMHEHKCPKCGNVFEFEVHESVNVDIDPDMKAKVLSAEIFLPQCPKCGERELVLYPMLYHDMTHKFMIQFTSPDGIDEFEYMVVPKETGDKQRDELLGLIRDMNKGYIRRATSDLMELFDKIEILENGFDDRIVEVIRYEIISHTKDEIKSKKLKGKIESTAIRMLENNEGRKSLVCIVTLSGKQEQLFYEIKDDLYSMQYKRYKDRLPYYDNCLVDQDFADKFIYDYKMHLPVDCKEDDRELFCTYDENGQFRLCVRKHTCKESIAVGDVVNIETRDGGVRAKVEKIVVKNYTVFPKWCSKYDAIAGLAGGELKAALERYKEMHSLTNVIEVGKLLLDKQVITPMRMNIGKADMGNMLKAKEGDTLSLQEDMRLRFSIYESGDKKKYIPVFTDKYAIKNEVEYDTMLHRYFTDIISDALLNEGIEGVIVNPDSDMVYVA